MVLTITVTIATYPNKTVYKIGEEFDPTGMTLYYNERYNNGIGIDYFVGVRSDMVSGFDSSTPGVKNLIVSYEGFDLPFTVTVEEDEPAYAIILGPETMGGAGYQRSIDIVGGSLEGKFIVARAASGSGESTKLIVMLISAASEAVVSYAWPNADIDVWLTDGLPNLTGGVLGAIIYATAGSGS